MNEAAFYEFPTPGGRTRLVNIHHIVYIEDRVTDVMIKLSSKNEAGENDAFIALLTYPHVSRAVLRLSRGLSPY